MESFKTFGSLICSWVVAVNASGLTLIDGSVDTSATSTSGKLGSASGAIIDNPDATTVVDGAVSTSSASATAGPIPPGNSTSLPGTDGIASTFADASIDATLEGILAIDLTTFNNFEDLDGGLYQGLGSATFDIQFTVPTEVDYTFIGSFQIDPENVLWKIQLKNGPGAFLINNATRTEDAGSIDLTGTLEPGYTYTLEGSVAVSDTLNNASDGIQSLSTFSTTLTVPEPASLTLLACGLAVATRRRR